MVCASSVLGACGQNCSDTNPCTEYGPSGEKCRCISKKCLDGAFVGNPFGGDTYSLSISLTSAEAQQIAEMGGICLLKGTTTVPTLQPVWYRESNPGNTNVFSWQINYGVYFSSSDYSAGVTLNFGSNEDVNLGTCNSIDGSNIWAGCTDVAPSNAVLIESKRPKTSKNYVVAGMYQNLNTQKFDSQGHLRSRSTNLNAFYANKLFDVNGKLLIQPIQKVTVGACFTDENALAAASSLTGAYTFDFSSTFSIDACFDASTNSFAPCSALGRSTCHH